MLLISLICGNIIDLLFFERVGLHGLNYFFTTWLLYAHKDHFFIDDPKTIPTMTFLFSIVSRFIEIMLFAIIFSIQHVNNELIYSMITLPILDGIYAYVVKIPLAHFAPLHLFSRKEKPLFSLKN